MANQYSKTSALDIQISKYKSEIHVLNSQLFSFSEEWLQSAEKGNNEMRKNDNSGEAILANVQYEQFEQNWNFLLYAILFPCSTFPMIDNVAKIKWRFVFDVNNWNDVYGSLFSEIWKQLFSMYYRYS